MKSQVSVVAKPWAKPVRVETMNWQSLFEDSRMESRLQAGPRENRLKALQTERIAAQALFQTVLRAFRSTLAKASPGH